MSFLEQPSSPLWKRHLPSCYIIDFFNLNFLSRHNSTQSNSTQIQIFCNLHEKRWIYEHINRINLLDLRKKKKKTLIVRTTIGSIKNTKTEIESKKRGEFLTDLVVSCKLWSLMNRCHGFLEREKGEKGFPFWDRWKGMEWFMSKFVNGWC